MGNFAVQNANASNTVIANKKREMTKKEVINEAILAKRSHKQLSIFISQHVSRPEHVELAMITKIGQTMIEGREILDARYRIIPWKKISQAEIIREK
jgi:hypothetical protein